MIVRRSVPPSAWVGAALLVLGACRGAAPAAEAAPRATAGRPVPASARASRAAPAAQGAHEVLPLAAGQRGLALRVGKLLTMDAEARVYDRAMLVIRAGKIEYVGPPVELPEGFPSIDLDRAWASPGMVDLHSHVQTGSWEDINDMVLPINTDLRVRPSVVPSNPWVRKACAGGVTTLFGIPGSGTSISGFGLLYKTKTDAGYEDIVVRDPGGMKSAFNFNPQRSGGDMGRSWAGLSWLTEDANDRAAAAVELGVEDPLQADFLRVHRGELPVLIHCASAEGVAGTVRMWHDRYHTQCIVSHGSWDGHLVGPFVAERGVPVNHGPRTMNFTSMVREEKILGTAAEYVNAGVPLFSLNTDAGVIPQEELFLQGTMSARLGADSYQMLEAVTTNPARSILIGDRVGSLEPGKDADVVVSTGDPLDPRSRVELVLIDGEIQYSRERDGQWF